ncbi:MAG: hypothetical protein Q7R80_05095, partial [bacterium]|nr:hypothetical protein [bacterium]
ENEMDTKEKPKDPHDPREYRPVPKGGYKIFVMVSTIQVVTAVLGWWLIVPIFSRPVGTHVIPNALLFVLWAVVSVRFFVKEILPALDEYVLRTARGYRLACWLGHPLAGKQLLYRVIAPGTPVGDVAQPTLILPLGGWFRRPTILDPNDHGWTIWPLKRGQVRMVGPLELLHQDGAASAIALNVVQLTDATGDRHTTTVWGALELLDEHGVRMLTDPHNGTLRRVFGGALAEVRRLTDNLTAQRKVLNNHDEATVKACGEREEAIKFVKGLAIEIGQASRLTDGIEGLRALDRICTWLCQAYDGTEQLADAKVKLALVRAKLAEKVKADRRRHGRKAGTSAGT